MKAGGTEVGGGKRGALRIDSSISGVMRFICSVTRAASTAVPTHSAKACCYYYMNGRWMCVQC